MPKQRLLTDDDAAELVAVCKHCGQTVAIAWKMAGVSPWTAAQQAAEALGEHQRICGKERER